MNSQDRDKIRASIRITEAGFEITTGLNTLEPAWLDLTIYQGQDLSLKLIWRDESKQVVDVSGYTARLQIKQYFDTTALVSLTQADGITLAATSPNIAIARTAAVTAAYDWTRALWNLEVVTAGGLVTRLVEGTATLRKEVAA